MVVHAFPWKGLVLTMCGICGIVDFSGDPPVDTLARMNDALRHRGPDAGGTALFPSCALGHRRLSILDLSEAANQPMLSPDGKIALVFNGEIYNFLELRDDLERRGHVFRTRSDTEVILELYREGRSDWLQDLNGMFSIAIWDERVRKLILARDRLGKKPLYYHREGPRLGFSSELFSLVQDRSVPREMWEQSFFEYLLYDFIPGPHTIFRGVYRIPPGHFAIFDEEGFHLRRYWEPPGQCEDFRYDEARTALTHLLDDAVRRRLISDVPLGAFLSGGIDSTLVTALMRRHCTERVKTFSIAFPGTTHDESAWSELASRELGTDHRVFRVEYEIERIFPQMMRHFGEPFGDSSAVPTWHLSEMTRRDVTVALSGDGGDELFGGYDRYVARRLQLAYDLVPETVRRFIIEPLADSLPETTDYYGTSRVKQLKLFVSAARRMRGDPAATVPRTFSLTQARLLTAADYDAEIDPAIATARQWAGLDPVSRMMMADIQTYLAEDILTKVDRMSMAHALEVRSPLLDYRVVELAVSRPLSFKIRGLTTKRILRDVARDMIPGPILKRSKYGFQIPLGRWLRGELRTWGQERLFDSRHGFFRRPFVEKLWAEHQEARADHGHRLWLLICFNEWYAHMGS